MTIDGGQDTKIIQYTAYVLMICVHALEESGYFVDTKKTVVQIVLFSKKFSLPCREDGKEQLRNFKSRLFAGGRKHVIANNVFFHVYHYILKTSSAFSLVTVKREIQHKRLIQKKLVLSAHIKKQSTDGHLKMQIIMSDNSGIPSKRCNKRKHFMF